MRLARNSSLLKDRSGRAGPKTGVCFDTSQSQRAVCCHSPTQVLNWTVFVCAMCLFAGLPQRAGVLWGRNPFFESVLKAGLSTFELESVEWNMHLQEVCISVLFLKNYNIMYVIMTDKRYKRSRKLPMQPGFRQTDRQR